MKLFVDTASLDEIKDAFERGIVSGVTTNPSILAREPKTNFEELIRKIIDFLRTVGRGQDQDPHLSVEVFSRDPEEILRQARRFAEVFAYGNLSIKVQIGYGELKVIRILAKEGFSVNCTCCMDTNQAVLAASAGAKFVSLFWGRIRDVAESYEKKKNTTKPEHFKGWQEKWFGGQGILDRNDFEPQQVVGMTRFLFERDFPGVQIIVGSIRRAPDIRDAALSGAHIVTVPPKFFPQMAAHFKTDEVVQQFLDDFEGWMK